MSRKAAQRMSRRAMCSQSRIRSKARTRADFSGRVAKAPAANAMCGYRVGGYRVASDHRPCRGKNAAPGQIPVEGPKADGDVAPHASLRFSMAWRWAVVGCALAACSSRVPHPSYTARSTVELVEADYPPPPAHVEFVPAQPSGEAVWLNGEWSWTGRRWGWKPGGWVVPPPGAAYAKGAIVRRPDGRLFAASSRWQGPDGGEIPAPEFVRTSPAKSSSVVDPEGDPAPTAGDLPADGGTGSLPHSAGGTVDASTMAEAATPDAEARNADGNNTDGNNTDGNNTDRK
jgi:hypothetical protein